MSDHAKAFENSAASGACLRKLAGDYVSANYSALLKTAAGYAVLHFPQDHFIHDVPLPEQGRLYETIEDFERHYAVALLQRAIDMDRLAERMEDARGSMGLPKEPQGEMKLYARRIDAVYAVVKGGRFYSPEMDGEREAVKGQGLIYFSDGRAARGRMADIRRAIVPVPSASGPKPVIPGLQGIPLDKSGFF